MDRPKYYWILRAYGRDYYVEANTFGEACRKCDLDPNLTKVIHKTED